MKSLKFRVVPHPPSSLDLGTIRLLVVPKIEGDVKRPTFFLNAEVEAAVCKWISSQPETFFIHRMKKWIERLKKCVALNGDYVEK
jgi:hypothetical protein